MSIELLESRIAPAFIVLSPTMATYTDVDGDLVTITISKVTANGIIGAIFLRTERESEPFTESDVRFCQVIASLTAKALRNAHRFESLLRSNDDREETRRRSELERIALMAFLRRLLDRYTAREDHLWAETLLPRASDDELDRLVSVAMQVLQEEAKG